MIDGFLTNKITSNLNNKILSGKIQKIYQINNNELIFKVRANKENFQLLNSVSANSFRLSLTNNKYSTLQEATNLTMLFRKHLEGGVIKNIVQDEFDRTITIEISKLDDLRVIKSKYLIFELLNRHSNTILCDHDFTIITSLKSNVLANSLTRIIHKGAKYVYPSKQAKKNPLNNLSYTLDYQSEYQGFSKYLNEEFKSLKQDDDKVKELFNEYLNSTTYYVYPKIISAIKLTTSSEPFQIFNDLDVAFDSINSSSQEDESIKYLYNKQIKFIKGLIKKNNKKIIKLEKQINDNLDYEKYLNQASLLYDNIYLFDKNKHYENVLVNDFLNDSAIDIALDNKYSYMDNAARTMKVYNKKKKSFFYLEQQIELAQKQNNYLISILDNLDYANVNDAKEIIDELYHKNILQVYKQSKKPPKKVKPRYETYYSSDDTTILVGKTSIQNDYITFNIATKENYWLHIQDLAGAHVIILDDNPSEATLFEAATLALIYSKAQANIDYVVNYTKIKNIKKQKNAAAGQVNITSYKSLRVTNDLNILNGLKKG